MLSDHRLEPSARDAGRSIAGAWSPRLRLLLLIAALAVTWGAFLLLIAPLV